jgi:hypothetical protein
MYYRKESLRYYSWRYDKFVTVPVGYPSDGATGARDIDSDGWWVHDKLCDTGLFDDGTKCNNWQASMILYDILKAEGYWFRARTWLISTYAMGGGKARENGMY